MSQHDRHKWDSRYAERTAGGAREASALVREWVTQAARGHALDIACGTGRNAIFLATKGFTVDALDISPVALAQARETAAAAGVTVNWIEHDLDMPVPVCGPYRLVIQLHYINAAITRDIPALLAPGGLFICQQHLQSAEPVAGPQNAAFRVVPGELVQLAAELEILHYSEGLCEELDGEHFALAKLVARRTQHATTPT